MPKIATQLTDTEIKKAKPKDKPYTLSDGNGLSILIKDTTKLWEFRYTSPTTLKRRKTSLGSYPKCTIKQARDKALMYHNLINDGIDPIDQNKEIKEQIKINQEGVFEKVVDEWLEKQKGTLAELSYKRTFGLLERDLKPFFKDRLIASIKHPEIVKILELKASRAPESASRLYQYLGRIWKYATMKGYCEFNIIANIEKKAVLTPHKAKHFPKVTDKEILAELVDAIYHYSGHYSTKNALKFVLHLPLRADNLIKLKWTQIDFDQKLLTIKRADMKVKNSNMPDFVMPLTDEVIKILKEQLSFSNGRGYVFTADGFADTPINHETPNRALQRMGFNDEKRERKQRLHSFRGTFRSLADTLQEQHKVSFEAKERALDHFPQSEVLRAYSHKANYIKELEKLMSWWSGFIVDLLDKDNR
jgi:integrase